MDRRGAAAVSAPPSAVRAAAGTRQLRPPTPASAGELADWRGTATEQLSELLAIDPARGDGRLTLTEQPAPDGQPQLVNLHTDEGEIPCWLLTPPPDRRLDAAVVAVAGHGPGIDALVEASPEDGDYHGGLARKLVAAGFTVLCPEMISFGRRRTPMPEPVAPTQNTCQVDAMRGLLTGRPVLGRRVADTLAAVRAVRNADLDIDPTKISVLGGSGGGAVSLLTAALDDQLAAAVVGTFFSTFTDSFCAVPHCICNAVPGLLSAFEMADLAALVAPRRLIIEAGQLDPIFPIEATRAAYAELLPVWTSLGAHPPDLVITEAGHQFLADDSIALLRAHVDRP